MCNVHNAATLILSEPHHTPSHPRSPMGSPSLFAHDSCPWAKVDPWLATQGMDTPLSRDDFRTLE